MAIESEAQNPITRSVNYFRNSFEELKKVHAPSRQETMQATAVVMILVLLFAVFLGLADLIVGRLVQWLLT